MACFQRHEISDARFIRTSRVVNHENVARSRSIDGLQKNVNASTMPRRANTAGKVRVAPQRPRAGRCAANLDAEAHACVCDMRSGEVKVDSLEIVVCHMRFSKCLTMESVSLAQSVSEKQDGDRDHHDSRDSADTAGHPWARAQHRLRSEPDEEVDDAAVRNVDQP
jgi:hypothetical protein